MTTDDSRQLAELLTRIQAAENSGDAASMVDLLAEDAVIMAPDFPVHEGKAACAEFVTAVINDQFTHFDRRIAYISAEVRVLGSHAFDRGSFSFTVTPRSGGDLISATGRYMFLYARDAAGSWKLARAIMNLDTPPETPAS